MIVEFQLNCTGGWVDYSNFVDVTGLKLIKSLDQNNDPQKNTTGEIECWGDAYTFINTNLVDSVNLYSNSICVKVTDTDCNIVHNFKIETKNLKWCDGEECKVRMTLIEFNPVIDCIKNTVISDNTNGEFQAFPASGNPHPRFRYCDVIKPTFFFGMLMGFVATVDLFILSLNFVLISVFVPLLWTINLFFGTNYQIPQIEYTASSFSGCNRLFPAPFIKTYIDNPCTLCGVTVDDTTDPIFHDPASLYRYAALLTAYTTKGILQSSAKDYIVNNRPSWTLFDLMSKLKMPWNGRFFLKNNTHLHFNRKDLLGVQLWGATPIVDVSSTGADYVNLLGNVCFTWNGEGKPSRINMKYSNDGSDNIGNELLCRFNGEWLDTSGNPNYNTPVEKITPDFGAMSFVGDGKDTIYDEILVTSPGILIALANFAGTLKTQGDTLQLAKILVWDQASMTDSRPTFNSWAAYAAIPAFADDEGPFLTIAAIDLMNYNYEMSFDPDAYAIFPNNLWPYHAIDIPAAGKKTNIAFEFKLQGCCPYYALELYMGVQFENDIGEIASIEYDKANFTTTIKGNLI